MTEQRYLTVTALTKYIKYKFDQDAHLKNVLLKGEISNFKHHSRGHFYFTLKDDQAQISAIMFAGNAKSVPFTPEHGMSVLVEGYISVYEASGNYQIYVKSMAQDGIGNLYLAYEKLKQKLEQEGLFDARHKRPIPAFPKTIAVLTSPTGAAVRDIIHIVNRRYPLARIIVYPTLVQGEYAKDSIVNQLAKVEQDGFADVILLGRGGGSIEDLWPFNEEAVAYAIFRCKIPIISAVGHETDFTISDFVADLRAPTPSGAAELAVPSQIELSNHLRQLQDQMRRALEGLLERRTDRLRRLEDSIVFRDPMRLFERRIRRLDHLDDSLRLLHPGARLKQAKKDLSMWTNRLQETYRTRLTEKRNEHAMLVHQLELINPLSLMKKGYSVTRSKQRIVTSVAQVETGDAITVQLQDGSLEATVQHIRKDDSHE
jgi:exodeoxyribonuclease VII large subunit